MKWGSAALLFGGGALTIAGIFYGKRKSDEVTDAITEGVNAPSLPFPPSTQLPEIVINKLPTVKIHATGYWPYVKGLSKSERLMEGGTQAAAVWRGSRAIDPNTGKRPIIYTLEQHIANPAQSPYVSVSGDPDVWPFGQRIILSPWPKVIFRVVDTGGHFTGVKKVFRVVGEEPLDIAVNGPQTVIPKKGVTAKIVPGDVFATSKTDFIAEKLKSQTVTFTGDDDIDTLIALLSV